MGGREGGKEKRKWERVGGREGGRRRKTSKLETEDKCLRERTKSHC